MRTRELACGYCGAEPQKPCIVTLAPEVGPLSVPWQHRTREEANLVREVVR